MVMGNPGVVVLRKSAVAGALVDAGCKMRQKRSYAWG